MPKKKLPEPILDELGLSGDLLTMEAQGVYTLIISVPVERCIDVGSLGTSKFPMGYFAYTGSALGNGASSLAGRIRRHLRTEKKKRWHIDYLLSDRNAEVTAVVATCPKKTSECEINRYIREKLRAEIPVPRFGSSDCVEKCGSHLLYLGLGEQTVRMVAELHTQKTGSKAHVFVLQHSRGQSGLT